VTRPTRTQLRALRERDPRLGAVLPTLPPFPALPDRTGPRWRTHASALAASIVWQQLSGKAAETIWHRACALTPGRGFPGARELLALSDEALRGAGLSRNKVAALRDLAGRIDRRELPLARLARMADEQVVERLTEVRGIGVWSAQMFLLFRLGRLDVLASGDLGVQEGLRILDRLDRRPTAREVEARAALWRPLASVGCWAMWRLVERERGR